MIDCDLYESKELSGVPDFKVGVWTARGTLWQSLKMPFQHHLQLFFFSQVCALVCETASGPHQGTVMMQSGKHRIVLNLWDLHWCFFLQQHILEFKPDKDFSVQ